MSSFIDKLRCELKAGNDRVILRYVDVNEGVVEKIFSCKEAALEKALDIVKRVDNYDLLKTLVIVTYLDGDSFIYDIDEILFELKEISKFEYNIKANYGMCF